MPAISVHELDVMSESTWSFRDNAPHWQHKVHGRSGLFDPFPAYAHDRSEVADAAYFVSGCCPPLWNVELYIANREEAGRCNGYSDIHQPTRCNTAGIWVVDKPVGVIVLSGKRVPPHPAMTRYLVAHEYGHHIEWMIGKARGQQSFHDFQFVSEYAKMRGLPDSSVHHGEGGTWHDSAKEIFACDFRIFVCGVEEDYWPHPGVPQPKEVRDLSEWWLDALNDLGNARQETAAIKETK